MSDADKFIYSVVTVPINSNIKRKYKKRRKTNKKRRKQLYNEQKINNKKKYSYKIKLYGIFRILNHNKNSKHIFNLLRKKMPIKFHDKTDTYHNIRLFYPILSYDFLDL